jgi:carbon storage regulator
MLILTRRVNESIMINDNVKFTILSTKGNQVRVGVIAPDDISIHREEIFNKIKRELKNGFRNKGRTIKENAALKIKPAARQTRHQVRANQSTPIVLKKAPVQKIQLSEDVSASS